MKKNVGNKDALIRIVAAFVIILVALFFIEGAAVRIIAAIVAAVLAITAFLNICPIYRMLEKNTCDTDGGAKAQPEASQKEQEPAQSETPVEGSEESTERTT